jgi:YggT family protein
MNPLVWLLLQIIDIYQWIVVATVVLSWLVAFNVVNMSNQVVRQIAYTLQRLTEPVLAPIRNALPSLGGVDISPVVLLLGLWFLRYCVVYASFRFL